MEIRNWISLQVTILDCSKAAVHSHPFSRISPGNIGGSEYPVRYMCHADTCVSHEIGDE